MSTANSTLPKLPDTVRFVHSVHLHDHHPVHDVEIELTPFTVIIGKNDTGKSTILDCIEAVLTDEVPAGRRPGWWVPTEEAEAYIRSRVELPLGPLSVRGPEHGRTFTFQIEGSKFDCPASLAKDMVRPAGEVVRLDPGRSTHGTGDAVFDFLAAVVEDSLEHGWGSSGDPHDPSDVRHLFDATHERASWVQPALDLLARDAFDLIPEFLSGEYDRLEIGLIIDGPGVLPEIVLVGDRGDCVFRDLSSGMQSWVHLAVREAARRLRTASTVIDGSEITSSTTAPGATLFLIDEPERHLHPEAAAAVAHWLHSLTRQGGREVSVIAATHSPAFLDLHRFNDVTVLQCLRQDLPDDDLEHSVTLVRRWTPPQVSAVANSASEIGMTLPDVFFTGSIPVIVEGRQDLEYFRRIWPLVCGIDTDSLGIRFFNAGGISGISDLISELIIAAYPPGAPVVLITDNPDLDYPANADRVKSVAARFPQVEVLSHKSFDIWAMIPEAVLDRHNLRRHPTLTWQSLEDQRRNKVLNKAKATLPGKSDLLRPQAAQAWPGVLSSLSPEDVPKRAKTIIHKVNQILNGVGG